MSQEDPIVIVKIKFDDLSPEVQTLTSAIYFFVLLLNIYLCINIIRTVVNTSMNAYNSYTNGDPIPPRREQRYYNRFF